MSGKWIVLFASIIIAMAFILGACQSNGGGDDDNASGADDDTGESDDDTSVDDDSAESTDDDSAIDDDAVDDDLIDDDAADDDSFDEDALYASICPNNQDPTAHEATELSWDNGTFGLDKHQLLPGDMESICFIPPHPFHLKKIKMYFAGGAGKARIHVLGDNSHSEPDETVDLMPPIDIDVPDKKDWLEFELPQKDLIFMPDQRFWITYEHLAEKPLLGQDNSSVDNWTSRQYSQVWAQQNPPWTWQAMNENYMIRAEGNLFCEREGVWFTETTTQAGIDPDYFGMRVAWGDYDHDGYDDLLITRGYVADDYILYHNNGDSTFTDVTAAAGINGTYAAFGIWGDVNNDGNLDIVAAVYVPQDGTDNGARSLVFLGDGAGHFTPIVDAGIAVNATTSAGGLADYDADGNLDLYFGNWLVTYPNPDSFPDNLFKGNGDGTFTDVSVASGIQDVTPSPAYGVTWADYNNDGYPDIFVANYGRTMNFLLENQGDGTFVDVAHAKHLDSPHGNRPGNTFSGAWGDFNNDGYMDIFLAEISHPRYQPDSEWSSLNVNSGPPDYTFHNIFDEKGIQRDEGEIDSQFIDYDNDGLLDLWVSDLYPGHFGRLLHQKADGSWEDVTYYAGITMHYCTNATWADYDMDGDLDLVVTRNSDGGHVALWRNDIGQDNNWLTIRLEGTTFNRAGIGARVTVTSGDLVQTREVFGGHTHFNSQPSLPVEYGLAKRDTIDSVTVRWFPGETETWTGIPINKFVDLKQGDSPNFSYYH